MASEPLQADVLAIAAHRDDVEQTCGGTLLRMAARGLRTAILDLTRGEAGTRGTAEERGREAAEAAKLLGVDWRDALDQFYAADSRSPPRSRCGYRFLDVLLHQLPPLNPLRAGVGGEI